MWEVSFPRKDSKLSRTSEIVLYTLKFVNQSLRVVRYYLLLVHGLRAVGATKHLVGLLRLNDRIPANDDSAYHAGEFGSLG